MAWGKRPLAMVVLTLWKSPTDFIQLTPSNTFHTLPEEVPRKWGGGWREKTISPISVSRDAVSGMFPTWAHRISQENHSLKAKASLRWQSQPGSSSSVARRVEATSAPTGTTVSPQWPRNKLPRFKCSLLRSSVCPPVLFCFKDFMRERDWEHACAWTGGRARVEGGGEGDRAREKACESQRASQADSVLAWAPRGARIHDPEMKPRDDA